LAPSGTPCQQEEHVNLQKPKLVEPQQEKSAEPQVEELAEPRPKEDVVHSQGINNYPSDYTPLSDPDDLDSEPEHVQATTEFCSHGEESSTVPAQLHGLLFQLGITRAS
jgi:hypothetical protein